MDRPGTVRAPAAGTGRASARGAARALARARAVALQANYPPSPTELFIPPLPMPDKVRGFHLVAEYDVDSTGKVVDFKFTPTRDGGYNKRLDEVLRELQVPSGDEARRYADSHEGADHLRLLTAVSGHRSAARSALHYAIPNRRAHDDQCGVLADRNRLVYALGDLAEVQGPSMSYMGFFCLARPAEIARRVSRSRTAFVVLPLDIVLH